MLQKSTSTDSSQKQDRTLIKIPETMEITETSVICGYINDSSSNQPVKNALITVTNRNYYEETYKNTTTTDSTGFYFLHVPVTRIRETITAQGYCDKSNYQLQVIENHTYWVNLSLLPRPAETAVILGYIHF